jgi:hypothetical protein
VGILLERFGSPLADDLEPLSIAESVAATYAATGSTPQGAGPARS